MEQVIHQPARDICVVDRSDVVVVGGGPAGIAAAVSAARNGASTDTGERICNSKPEIVVAVNGENGLIDVRDFIAQHGEFCSIVLRQSVTDRVGNVDRGGAGLDRGFDGTGQEIVFTAAAVFCRPFDVVGELAREGDALGDHGDDVIGLHVQLVLHVQR